MASRVNGAASYSDPPHIVMVLRASIALIGNDTIVRQRSVSNVFRPVRLSALVPGARRYDMSEKFRVVNSLRTLSGSPPAVLPIPNTVRTVGDILILPRWPAEQLRLVIERW